MIVCCDENRRECVERRDKERIGEIIEEETVLIEVLFVEKVGLIGVSVLVKMLGRLCQVTLVYYARSDVFLEDLHEVAWNLQRESLVSDDI